MRCLDKLGPAKPCALWQPARLADTNTRHHILGRVPPGIRIIPAGAKSGGNHERYHFGEDPHLYSSRPAPQRNPGASLGFGAGGHCGDLGRRAAGALRRARTRGQARAAPAEHHLGRQPEVATARRVTEDGPPLPLRSGGFSLSRACENNCDFLRGGVEQSACQAGTAEGRPAIFRPAFRRTL